MQNNIFVHQIPVAPIVVSYIASHPSSVYCICMSYNTGKMEVPCLIIMHDAQECTVLKGDSVYIRQSTSACVITKYVTLPAL